MLDYNHRKYRKDKTGKLGYDIPLPVRDLLVKLAEQEGVPATHLLCHLIERCAKRKKIL